MLALFRRFLNTWAARAFFMILVVSFAAWGVGDVIRNMGSSTAVATVGGRRIEMPEMQQAFQQQMNQLNQMLGGRVQPTDDMRRAAARQALDQLVTQAAIAEEERRLGLVVPDDALRNAVFAMPGFRGQDGRFNRPQFEQILQRNNLTEARFLELMRGDLGERQLMEAVGAGAGAPGSLIKRLFDFRGEKRVAAIVELPFAGAAAPPPPTDAQLHRWYDNHPDLYSAPEYRRVKAVILAPETVAKEVPVTDQEIQQAYDAHKSDFVTPEKRSAQVIVASSQDAAQKLADQWKGGADWAAMQAAAKAAGASSVELDAAAESEFPSPDLAKAVFAAQPNAVSGPVQTAGGWDVIDVPKVVAGSAKSVADVRDQIRTRIAQEKAADLIYDRANKLQDQLGAGTSLDDLPADLGVAAVEGTLDAEGTTPQGQPAPIPGGPDLRSALIAAAFQMKKGDPASLNEVPGQQGQPSSYYAVTVQDVTPPALKPFDAVQDQVRADWLRDAERHEQDEAATRLYMAVKSGGNLQDAAAIAGLPLGHTPPVTRLGQTPGVPVQLVQPLFLLKKGEATMVETGDGFVVAELTDIQVPDIGSDPVGYRQTTDALERAMGADLTAAFAAALRTRAHPRVNQQLLDTVAAP
jgi:peptidyl-prolyl cis-trans isomerase D